MPEPTSRSRRARRAPTVIIPNIIIGSSMFNFRVLTPGPQPVFFKQVGGRIGNFVNVNLGSIP